MYRGDLTFNILSLLVNLSLSIFLKKGYFSETISYKDRNGDIKTKVAGLNNDATWHATPVPIDLPINIIFYSSIPEWKATYL